MKTFPFFSDPGHGWLAVPKTMLRELGIANKITSCSYQRKEMAYLEEDCDLSTFVEAYEGTYGERPKFEEINSNGESPIRGYRCYEA